ncbi:Sterol 3-beta-glucosyltransferase [Rhizina undulata]
MPSDEENVGCIALRLSKLRRNVANASQSLHLPARFDVDDDSQMDASAGVKNAPVNLNQSIFQMLTAGTAGLGRLGRFDDGSDDSDAENDIPSPPPESSTTDSKGKGKGKKHVKRLSESRFLRPLKLQLDAIREARAGTDKDRTAHAGEEETNLYSPYSPGPAPIMSQMLEAQAQLNPAKLTEGIYEETEMAEHDESEAKDSPDLAKKLMEIFSLPSPEKVVAEYPCWLLKSVLIQGYMYITTKHICYYAYLPRKSDVIVKSGFLSKRGRSTVKYNRYWFTLKGDVLSYYEDQNDLYFPRSSIDLRYGIQATMVESKDKSKESTMFTVSTDKGKYYFRADSAVSAKEWVKALQKVIFRTHNDGDSVKISIPVENVMEVEECPMLDFAETVKLKVVDNDDTYAIDEYYFSFFSFGKDAKAILQAIVEDSTASKLPQSLLNQSGHSSPRSDTAGQILRENVRVTLSPPLSAKGSPRASGETSRSSHDTYRRSTDIRREDSIKSPDSTWSRTLGPFSTDSTLGTRGMPLAEPSEAKPFPSAEGSSSASQMLDRNDLSESPTMTMERFPHGPPRMKKSATTPETPSEIKIVPPTRTHTTESMHNKHVASPREHGFDHDVPPNSPEYTQAETQNLQRVTSVWAHLIRQGTQKLSFVGKVSDMWAGGRRHYKYSTNRSGDEIEGVEETDEDVDAHGERFRAHFALPPDEQLEAVFYGHLQRGIPIYGKVYLSDRNFCFRSLLPSSKTKMILPLNVIENVAKEKGFQFGYSGVVVTIRGHEELFFEFSQAAARDDCASTILELTEKLRASEDDGLLSPHESERAEIAKIEHQMLEDARHEGYNEHDLQLPAIIGGPSSESRPILFDDPCGSSIINFKPKPMMITCLTIGSRGDVQPFLALCKGLMKDGHKVRIATHLEFKESVEEQGIEFAAVEGNPAELMNMCVEYGLFTVEFLRQANSKMRGWLDGLLKSAYLACQGSDLLIESPSAMAGIHIAEALGIPYFRAFTMPWTRTRTYPHAFAVPDNKLGGQYNYYTYVIIDTAFWRGIAGQVNRWRKKMLHLPPTSLSKMQADKTPFIYNISPSVLVPPSDYSHWVHVSGYWFLDTATDWDEPAELVAFIKQAREDGKKIVYIGFGSVTVADPRAMTRAVVESVVKADVRCILSKGWSDRLSKKSDEPEIVIPPQIFQVKSVPHDWLFKQIDAAVHHGGAGTTGASLRAGLPTIIKPFFGDQYFYAMRVEDLGVGIAMKKLNVSFFSRALWEVTHNERIIRKANALGAQIRSENGVDTAIKLIYRDLDYARSLIKKHPADGHKDESAKSPRIESHDDSEEPWYLVEGSRR